ncbi:MAG: hypothetical protein KAU50_00255 [Candidatus Marinimicrobia bacterium]|nr:hypothetical protein [Candidatus Neomarinimicrobiota bacterium]
MNFGYYRDVQQDMMKAGERVRQTLAEHGFTATNITGGMRARNRLKVEIVIVKE